MLLFKYSYAFIALPGGLGTLDELGEALTLIQTGKIKNYPIVLMGVAYWRHLIDQLHHMVEAGTFAAADLDLMLVTDDVDQAMAHVQAHAIQAFGLRPRAARPRRLLWERRAGRAGGARTRLASAPGGATGGVP